MNATFAIMNETIGNDTMGTLYVRGGVRETYFPTNINGTNYSQISKEDSTLLTIIFVSAFLSFFGVAFAIWLGVCLYRKYCKKNDEPNNDDNTPYINIGDNRV